MGEQMRILPRPEFAPGGERSQTRCERAHRRPDIRTRAREFAAAGPNFRPVQTTYRKANIKRPGGKFPVRARAFRAFLVCASVLRAFAKTGRPLSESSQAFALGPLLRAFAFRAFGAFPMFASRASALSAFASRASALSTFAPRASALLAFAFRACVLSSARSQCETCARRERSRKISFWIRTGGLQVSSPTLTPLGYGADEKHSNPHRAAPTWRRTFPGKARARALRTLRRR